MRRALDAKIRIEVTLQHLLLGYPDCNPVLTKSPG